MKPFDAWWFIGADGLYYAAWFDQSDGEWIIYNLKFVAFN